MRLSMFYAWDNQAKILKSPIPPFGEELPQSADIEKAVTQVTTWRNEGASETTSRAVRVTKFDVTHYCNEYPLLRTNRSNDPEIRLYDLSNVTVLFFL